MALTDQTSSFADHLQRTVDIAFDVNVDASESRISSDLSGVGSFTNAAAGQVRIDLSGLGPVDKVLETEITPSTGTATISSSIDSDGNLTLSIDSDQDLTATDVDFLVKAIVKRDL